MISKEEAIRKLKEYWGTNKFVFQATFHVPKNVTPREGTQPFGYFENIRLNGELLEYPIDTFAPHEKRVTVYHVIKGNLVDQGKYEVTFDLAKDEYRKNNPFKLIVKQYKKLESTNTLAEDILRETITTILNEHINIPSPFQMINLANSVESLATDIYSEDKRFIYELIQNADDAALDEESELSIQILNNHVIIAHNGTPFNSKDIRGLCSIGLGTKTKDSTKTGYKGIGFKSVFGQPDGLVYVKSEQTLFRFDREYSQKKGWNTKWGNQSEWEEQNEVPFNCPWQLMPVLTDNVEDSELAAVLNNANYTVKTAIKIADSKQIFENINNFFGDAKFLLFLRRISRVEIIYYKHSIVFKKEKKQVNKEIVSLIRNNELLSNWLVKNWTHKIPPEIQKELKSDSKTPTKIQSMEKTEISFALEINDTFNEIKLLGEGHRTLYSYLPTTENEYNIPFIVNCNFLLDACREKIHKNRKWNEWLFQVIGYKTVECCTELLSRNNFETSYLSVFRNGFYPESDNFRRKLNAGLSIGLETFPIIKNRENKLCKLHEIALDRFNLHQVNSELPISIATFLNKTKEKNPLHDQNIIGLNDANSPIRKLRPLEITESDLQAYFNSDYVGQVITTSSNHEILSFLCSLEKNDASGGTWYTVVTKNLLIINQDGQLDNIKKVCFPIDLKVPLDTEHKNTFIHRYVYQSIKNNKELVTWLVKLEVTEPGNIPYLEKEIIGNIQNIIDESNYFDITNFIFKLHTDKLLTETHYVNLQELPLKTDKGLIKANQCVLPQIYNPSLDIEKILPKQAYLSAKYLQLASTHECRNFFKMLGVRDDIDFVKNTKLNSPNLPASFVEEANKFAKEGHDHPHLIGVFHPNTPINDVPYYLQTFTFFELTNNLEFAKIFWNRIFQKYSLLNDRAAKTSQNCAPPRDYTTYNLGGGMEFSTLDEMAWGRFPNNVAYIPSYFIWHIQNVKCIPTNKGIKLANESIINKKNLCELVGDFLPVIDIDMVVPEDWNKLLNLKTTLSIDDLFTLLKCISDLVERKRSLDKENEKRLGLIYNELMLKLDIDYANASVKMKSWASNNKLISYAKKTSTPCNLLYIKIAGFEHTNADINIIFLPQNVEISHPTFTNFLDILGVKIIDNFSYKSDAIRELYDLKIKLLKLIGPICLLLRSKLIVSGDINKAMYERYIKISSTQFIFCKNIQPLFSNENEVIEGKIVSFYHDKVEKKILISKEWRSPLTLLEISYDVSALLSAIRLEKEIMMLINMSVSDIEYFLTSQHIDLKEYKNSEAYKDIENEIEQLTLSMQINPIDAALDQLSNNNKSINLENKTCNENSQDEPEKGEMEKDSEANNHDSFWSSLTENDINFIRGIIAGDYEINDKLDANETAKIKTLMAIKDNYNASTISDEGRFLKAGSDEIIVRSAQNGILYLDVYHWNRLCEPNVRLSIHTNNQIKIFDKQKDLINYTKPQNKFGTVRMPKEYDVYEYNSLDNITDKGNWHYVFIVNENTKAAQNYKEVINLNDYNF